MSFPESDRWRFVFGFGRTLLWPRRCLDHWDQHAASEEWLRLRHRALSCKASGATREGRVGRLEDTVARNIESQWEAARYRSHRFAKSKSRSQPSLERC